MSHPDPAGADAGRLAEIREEVDGCSKLRVLLGSERDRAWLLGAYDRLAAEVEHWTRATHDAMKENVRLQGEVERLTDADQDHVFLHQEARAAFPAMRARAQTAERRVAELEAALREVAEWTSGGDLDHWAMHRRVIKALDALPPAATGAEGVR